VNQVSMWGTKKGASYFALDIASVYLKHELGHWQVVMREIGLFETPSQLKQMILKNDSVIRIARITAR